MYAFVHACMMAYTQMDHIANAQQAPTMDKHVIIVNQPPNSHDLPNLPSRQGPEGEREKGGREAETREWVVCVSESLW
jgi:hypothetical protein